MIAVSGAGGFIGSHVVDALCDAGHDVSELLGPTDPCSTGRASRSLRGDIRDVELLGRFVRGADAVVHLAGPPSVAASFADPLSAIEPHVVGTTVLIESMAAAGVAHLVHISSAEVYGVPEVQPVGEDQPTSPRSPYAAAKVAAEAVVGSASRSGLLRAVVLRPFSVYGPRQAPHSLLSELMTAAESGGTLEVRDPSPVRDFVWIGDLCAAVLAAAATTDGSTREPLVCNVASGVGTSVGRVACTVSELYGLGGEVRVLGADRPAEVSELVGNPERARRELGLPAATSLRDGLGAMIDGGGWSG